MVRATLTFIQILITGATCFSQNEAQALKLYEEGVVQFRLEKYKLADSLFTASLDLNPAATTFFGRGAARYNFSNVRGYCSDMSRASYYGDEEAKKQYASKCVIVDTVFNNMKAPQRHLSKRVDYREVTRGIYNDIATIKPYDKKGNQLAEFFIYKKDTTFTEIAEEENQPGPIGGYDQLTTFFTNETIYPKEAKDKDISGIVLVECIINKNGSVSDVKVGKGIGYGCDEEALRVVNSMPKWRSGTYLGKPIKSLVELPIKFPGK